MACKLKKPKMKLGGALNKVGQVFANYGRAGADLTLSGLGMKDVISDDAYKGAGSKFFKGAVDINNKVKDIARPIVGSLTGTGAVLNGVETAGNQIEAGIQGDEVDMSQLSNSAMGLVGGADMLSNASTNSAAMRNVPTMEYGGQLPISEYKGPSHEEGSIDIGNALVEGGEMQWMMPNGGTYIFSNSLGENGKIKKR